MRYIYIYLSIYLSIYIYYAHAVELLIGPSLGVFKVIDWAKFVRCLTLFIKTLFKFGFQHILYKKKLRAYIFKAINWAKLAFFLDP